MTGTDLHDTTNCPRGHRCESCGTAVGALTVETARTPAGVFCWTLCRRCAASTVAPPIGVETAVRFVAQHGAHLAVTPGGVTR